MLLLLLILPVAASAAAFCIPSERRRPWVLAAHSIVYLGVVLAVLGEPQLSAAGGWLVLDPVARLALLVIAFLNLACSLYAPFYLSFRSERPNRVFCSCMLLLLASMSLALLAHHLGLMWVAMEGTTLAGVTLLFFNRTPRSLEAAWKMLLICSVGIAIALLGSFFLAYASIKGGSHSSLLVEDLAQSAGSLSAPWLRAAFVTLLIGYGTKMGLAPLHTWKPDAYGEAPGIASAMMAGGVTTCAFVAILRFTRIAQAAGEGEFVGRVLVAMGLLSMAFAAVFMVRQKDYKRLLAYSSVEHMGILILGIGIGGGAVFGACLHLINNSLAKGALFLASGNIHRAYGSKVTDDVSGALVRVPFSAGLFLLGSIAITGSPPFGPFVSQLAILRGAFDSGKYLAGGLFLALQFAVFLGMGSTVLAVVQGPEPKGEFSSYRDTAPMVLPAVLLLLPVLLLGVFVPAPLEDLLRQAAAYLQGVR